MTRTLLGTSHLLAVCLMVRAMSELTIAAAVDDRQTTTTLLELHLASRLV